MTAFFVTLGWTVTIALHYVITLIENLWELYLEAMTVLSTTHIANDDSTSVHAVSFYNAIYYVVL